MNDISMIFPNFSLRVFATYSFAFICILVMLYMYYLFKQNILYQHSYYTKRQILDSTKYELFTTITKIVVFILIFVVGVTVLMHRLDIQQKIPDNKMLLKYDDRTHHKIDYVARSNYAGDIHSIISFIRNNEDVISEIQNVRKYILEEEYLNELIASKKEFKGMSLDEQKNHIVAEMRNRTNNIGQRKNTHPYVEILTDRELIEAFDKLNANNKIFDKFLRTGKETLLWSDKNHRRIIEAQIRKVQEENFDKFFESTSFEEQQKYMESLKEKYDYVNRFLKQLNEDGE